ncbi:MAG: phosphate ABC transporter permease subunit PstC [Candidatus Adiutrix sp.]|jgi:phosphate transport system permease protein|nr:phosphate ABC transporter permease subunit PstC [Candidatus Adiutrix sp.]
MTDDRPTAARSRPGPGRPEPAALRPRLSPGEKSARLVFLLCACLALGLMILITLFLFRAGAGIFLSNEEGPGISPADFFFNQAWYPTYDPPDFGILALLAGSLSVTLLSALIAIPLGLSLAVYLACLAGPRIREIVKPAVELLAAVPSVVLGFVGLVLIAPFMQEVMDLPTGLNLMNAGLLLALMATPTVASLGEDAVSAVPVELRDAAYALGATRWETIRQVIMPAAVSGLTTAVILGLGRALGETMVVLMVAGGSAQAPRSLFDSVRPLTSTLAAEMAETPIGSHHYYALFAIGVVLFLMTLAFNLLAFFISRRWRGPEAR